MKIALCHLDVSMGPEEKNVSKLERTLEIALDRGVDWIITPETALQGYYFYRNDPSKKNFVQEQPSRRINNLLALLKNKDAYFFLGAGEYDSKEKKNFNSCLVFGSEGKLIGRHRKIFNHGLGSEAWAEPGTEENAIQCGKFCVGVLVCADAWFYEHMEVMKQKGAELFIVIAAWPPTKETGDPIGKWQENANKSGLPFILCNQTGKNPYMNMEIGQSFVIVDGEVKLSYSGEEAILFFELDVKQKKVTSECFTVVRV